jgi:hypothetical protein
MTTSTDLASVRTPLAELAPLLRRAVRLDAGGVARIRVGNGSAAVLVRLPFDVLVARTVACDHGLPDLDVVVRASDLLTWLDGESDREPERHEAQWRAGLPPSTGWRRIDTVPDDVVRDLVRSGALALQDAAAREGVPDAAPRAEVADALLDSIVLTVTAADAPPAKVSLRALSALTRMGVLPRGSHIAVDMSGRWIRVAAEYGSVFTERPGLTLNLS